MVFASRLTEESVSESFSIVNHQGIEHSLNHWIYSHSKLVICFQDREFVLAEAYGGDEDIKCLYEWLCKIIVSSSAEEIQK